MAQGTLDSGYKTWLLRKQTALPPNWGSWTPPSDNDDFHFEELYLNDAREWIFD